MARNNFTPSTSGIRDDSVYPGGFNHRDEANALVAWVVRSVVMQKLPLMRWLQMSSDKTLTQLTDRLIIHAAQVVAELLQLRDSDPEDYYRQIKEYGQIHGRSLDQDV